MELKSKLLSLSLLLAAGFSAQAEFKQFPDGSPVPAWFNDAHQPELNSLGKQYVVTEHGVVNDSTVIQTERIQAVIDLAAQNGGGVVVIPEGVMFALFQAVYPSASSQRRQTERQRCDNPL